LTALVEELGSLQSHEPIAIQIRHASALLSLLGWPGEPLTGAVELEPAAVSGLRRAAFMQLADGGGAIDEAATAVVNGSRKWDADHALDTVDDARAVLGRPGWHEEATADRSELTRGS
jgi:hypothetical protein